MNWHLLNPFNEDFGSLTPIQRAERLVVIYWVVSTVLGLAFLSDWIFAWNVPATLGNPWLVGLLFGTLLLSQTLYIRVSHGGGRPIRWGATWLFAICNGLAETFAFAIVFRLGLAIGGGLMSLLVPAWSTGVGFALGLLFFVLYGGAIHGLFWIRLLPPHFHDDPMALRIRRLRPLSETLLVVGWSLAWWLHNDLWSVVICHTIIDLTLMIQVRPPLFQHTSTEPEPDEPAPIPEHVQILMSPPAQPRQIYGLAAPIPDETYQLWSKATSVAAIGALALLELATEKVLPPPDHRSLTKVISASKHRSFDNESEPR